VSGYAAVAGSPPLAEIPPVPNGVWWILVAYEFVQMGKDAAPLVKKAWAWLQAHPKALEFLEPIGNCRNAYPY
jgi:hypothetical protein